MKHMTKEWYLTMQKTDIHLLLRDSKMAEVFSEDYFKKLYNSEEKAWLKLHKNISEVKFEDIFAEEFQAEHADGSPLEEEEFEEALKVFLEMREQARLNPTYVPVFDHDQEKKRFRQMLNRNIKHLEESLPDDILQRVADIRVLALNRASADIKREITKYCKANEKAVRSASKAYWNEYKKSFENDKPAFIEGFNFHDCKVMSSRKKGRDIVITLDNSGGFTKTSQVILKNCSILKKDTSLYGAWWLYDEIYKTNEHYEIHVLLDKNKLIDFIFTATDVEYK